MIRNSTLALVLTVFTLLSCSKVQVVKQKDQEELNAEAANQNDQKILEVWKDTHAEELIKLSEKVVRVAVSKNDEAIYTITYSGKSTDITAFEIKNKKVANTSSFSDQPRRNTFRIRNGTASFVTWIPHPIHEKRDSSLIEVDLSDFKINKYVNDMKKHDWFFRGYDKSPTKSQGLIVDDTGNVSSWDFHQAKTDWVNEDLNSVLIFDNKPHVFYSEDGKLAIATASIVDYIVVIDAHSGDTLYIIPTSEGISSISLSSDNSTLAYAIKNSKLVIHELPNKNEINVLRTNKSIDFLEFTANNKCLVACDSRGQVSVLDVYSGDYLISFQANKGWVEQLNLSPKSSFGVSSGPSNELSIWDLPFQCKDEL